MLKDVNKLWINSPFCILLCNCLSLQADISKFPLMTHMRDKWMAFKNVFTCKYKITLYNEMPIFVLLYKLLYAGKRIFKTFLQMTINDVLKLKLKLDK